MKWTVLVPLRGLPNAKSRLAQDVPAQLFAALVTAIRADTIAAARAASGVARVLIIGDEPGEHVDIVQTSAGLNGALRDGAAAARRRWPRDGVATLVGDLPALRADELSAALREAASHPAGFVRDHEGSGTTLLTAAPGTVLVPRFGPGSAAAHAASATELSGGVGLRHDVDTAADLAAAAALGVGPATTAALQRLALRSP